VVLGQIIEVANTQDGHPFLRRQSLKRGIIHSICDTKIHFVPTEKAYDFFADDGSALTLTEKHGVASLAEDAGVARGSSPNKAGQLAEDEEVELDENLTGRDLIQLTRKNAFRMSSPDQPADITFDSEDIKKGAYVVCRRHFKAVRVEHDGLHRATAPQGGTHTGKQEISILAGTLGRIEENAGFRSEPLWAVEILPDSVPPPLLQSLISLTGVLSGPREPTLPSEVILASSDVEEINHYLDRSGVERTRLGEISDASGVAERGTMSLPMLYARPVLPLEENLTTAEKSGVLAAVQEATRGLRLVFRNPTIIAQRRVLVFDERASDGSQSHAEPNLLRRQCFLGMDRLGSSPGGTAQTSTRPALLVTGADIRVFYPTNWPQVPPGYYAIDLELIARANFSPKQVPLVCRFPLASIDLALVDMAQSILATRFEVNKE
jgi:hypothetical protein